MTSQEQDLLRLAAWDHYEANKTAFLACKAKLQRFREPVRCVTEKLLVDPTELTEEEVLAFPDKDSLVSAFKEFRNALASYEEAIEEARKFKWPVSAADEPTALCRTKGANNGR